MTTLQRTSRTQRAALIISTLSIAVLCLGTFALMRPTSAAQTPTRLAQVTGSEESTGPAAERRTTTRQLSNPLGTSSIPTLVGRGIQILTGVSGSIALLMFVWGGVVWLTSGGSPEKVQKGKKVFTWASIGLLIIFGSYALVNAIFGAIGA